MFIGEETDEKRWRVLSSVLLKHSYRRQLFVMDTQYVEAAPHDGSGRGASGWMESDVAAGVAEQSSYEKVRLENVPLLVLPPPNPRSCSF